MENVLGSKGNPYTYSDYQTICQNSIWHGGWVRYDIGKLVYITANNSVEQDYDDYLGSEENPFSEIAYDEMMVAGTWPGGNVRHGNDIVYHVNYEEQMGSGSGSGNESGSGSGSENGSGSGSGSGVGCGTSYVQFGHEDIATAHDEKVRISLTWNSGYIGIGQIPPSFLSIHPHVRSPYEEISNDLHAQWDLDNDYHVIITGKLRYKLKGTITLQILSISSYDIPDSYRGEPQS